VVSTEEGPKPIGLTNTIGSINSSRKPDRSLNVLFLCRDNTTASIIAEAILKRWGGPHFRAFSAGSQAGPQVHPLAVEIMKSQRVWREDLKVKAWQSFLGPEAPTMDFVISVGARAPDGLPPRWPGNPRVMHWRITEPLVDGDRSANARGFRKTFSELDTRIRLFALVNERETLKRAAA
jgi:arsenate reductase